ncbi:MAG: hypothetical protein RIR97_1894 [Pseudomonadota bacterium]|jgi:hypothetical protein
MDHTVKAATPEEIQAHEARKAAANQPPARQVLPEGFQSEKTIKLTIPVEFGGITYSEISIRRLKGADFARLKSVAGDADAGLLSLVCSVPPQVLGEIDADDYLALAEEARDFLPRRLMEEVAPTSDAGRSSQL